MKNLSILYLCFIVLFGCKNISNRDVDGSPKELTIAFFGGSGDNNGSVKKAMEGFRLYLEKKTHKKVKLYITSDYTAVIEALNSNKAQIGYLSPFSYVLAAQKNNIIPLVAIGQDGKPSMYHSIVFANKKSGIHNIDQLKNQASKLSLSFSDPASTSGHLIPFSFFQSIGIDPDKNFKEVVFSGSHAGTVLAVTSNKIDIGCSTNEYGTDILIQKGIIKNDDFTILWKSDPIIASPIVIRRDIDKKYIEKIKQLYLNLNVDDSIVFKNLMKIYHLNYNELSYMPINDSLYNGVRKIANNIKDVALLKNH